jgi:5-(carboxyamino)imidazole ribonucleotide mutase
MNAIQQPPPPTVGIVMGSTSDWPTMRYATEILEELGVPYETRVVSAHRTPQRLYRYAQDAADRGLQVIIAGAGGAAHLPGMMASMTLLPVIAVPVNSRALNGLDSLLSIAQMPRGVAVATQAIGEGGAFNAGLMAVQMLALGNDELQQKLALWRRKMTDDVTEEVVTCT